ncbi:hypothetical protein MBLNU459_g5069t1 [Dothideomycetes sp. NU459]
MPSNEVKDSSGYYPAPYSLVDLPDVLHRGLWAPGLLGLVSVLSTIALLCFILYRFSTWRKHYKTFVGYNQFVVLIMNLLIADFFQGLSFLVSFHWISVDGILAPTAPCFVQGFLLNIGDLASGFFVMAIALHTFYTAVKGRRIEHGTFTVAVIFCWSLALLLSIIGPAIYRNKYYVRAGAWCWAGPDYEEERLALHYIWIFVVQFGIIILYAAIFLHLKQAVRRIMPTLQAQSSAYAQVDRAAKLMILYPLFYILLTLPLSAGRMWSMAHHGASLPNAFQCVAGAMIASCGWVDALLYTLTRKTLILGNSPRTHGSSHGLEDGKSSNVPVGLDSLIAAGITQTRTVTVTAGNVLAMDDIDEEIEDANRGRAKGGSKYARFQRGAHSPTGSIDPIMSSHMGIGAEKATTNVHVTATPLDQISSDDDTEKSSLEEDITARDFAKTRRGMGGGGGGGVGGGAMKREVR